jgi:hypothetical protein
MGIGKKEIECIQGMDKLSVKGIHREITVYDVVIN